MIQKKMYSKSIAGHVEAHPENLMLPDPIMSDQDSKTPILEKLASNETMGSGGK
jgi:hypothetical protein